MRAGEDIAAAELLDDHWVHELLHGPRHRSEHGKPPMFKFCMAEGNQRRFVARKIERIEAGVADEGRADEECPLGEDRLHLGVQGPAGRGKSDNGAKHAEGGHR